MEQVSPSIDIEQLLKEATELRQYDLNAKAFTDGDEICLHIGQKYQNTPEKVVIEVISGFDIVARKEMDIHNNEICNVIRFKKGALSPITGVIAVKACYDGDGSHARVYLQRIGNKWVEVLWKTFVEDVIHIEKTYKRKYTHW